MENIPYMYRVLSPNVGKMLSSLLYLLERISYGLKFTESQIHPHIVLNWYDFEMS